MRSSSSRSACCLPYRPTPAPAAPLVVACPAATCDPFVTVSPGIRRSDMGNAATASKHPESGRAFSPDFTPAAFSPRDLTASPYPEDGIHVPKNKILRHMTSDGDNDDDRLPDDDGYAGRVRATTIVNSSINENALPTVFKWEGGGKEVFITGTFSNWKPIKMCPSHGDFVAIVDVPEGVHEYKYIVDGAESISKDSEKNETKNSNVIHVKKCDFEVFEALAMDLASNDKNQNANNTSFVSGSPPGEYSQELPAHLQAKSDDEKSLSSSSSSSAGSGPPILPPHLLQVILNNPNVCSGDSTLLPQPNHVMLNHLYALSIKDGVMVLSCTHRFRKKYVTTLLYKPI